MGWASTFFSFEALWKDPSERGLASNSYGPETIIGRVPTGQGKVREICRSGKSQGIVREFCACKKVREKSGNFKPSQGIF